jgi:hypothetical protein
MRHVSFLSACEASWLTRFHAAAAGRGGQRHVQRRASRRASSGGGGAAAGEHDEPAAPGGARAHAVRRRALRRGRRGGLRVPAGAVRCARPAAGSPPVPTAPFNHARCAAAPPPERPTPRARAPWRLCCALARRCCALRALCAAPRRFPPGLLLEAASARLSRALPSDAAALVLYIAYGPGHAGGVLERAAGSRWGARSARA